MFKIFVYLLVFVKINRTIESDALAWSLDNKIKIKGSGIAVLQYIAYEALYVSNIQYFTHGCIIRTGYSVLDLTANRD